MRTRPSVTCPERGLAQSATAPRDCPRVDSVSTPLTLVAPPSTLVAPPSPRPWNPFHTDSSRLTINVALDPPGRYTGGTLLGCFDAQVVPLPRLCLGRSSGVSRVHLVCISCASCVHLVCVWHVPGMCLVCVLHVSDMCLVCVSAPCRAPGDL